MARYDDLHTGVIAYATLLSSIFLVVIILLVRALCCYWVEAEDARKLANAHYVSSDLEISEQKGQLDGYGKETVEVAAPTEEDPDAKSSKEVIRIPVERARDLLLAELSDDE